MYDPNAVKIYTDGSAIPNPGSGGIGLIVEFPESFDRGDFELSEGYFISTNNRMELMACLRALEWLQTQRFTRAIIITDSEYVCSNHRNALYWKKNQWRTPEGKPYENIDLWDIFLRNKHKIKLPVELIWEKGKKRPILLRVDALAKQGANNPTRTDSGFQPGKFTAPRTPGGKTATLYSPRDEKPLIRVYKKNIYGKNENAIYKIIFDIYDEIKGIYAEKRYAYLKNNTVDLKRNNCYRAVFNDDPKFPLIIDAVGVEYLKNRK
ncbi:MAG: hypothetical protein UT05_C0007G0020 [Parcubacteria group bacterium GW2011_GWF2_38_76]|nr:MAG: hypothetical protein UT05_C0007G0020 [Parcubacteria group bacterium GW2011_GWF2_38_76]HBM46105.1 hypothetical protein [Patescibacteria group bacterium]